MSDIHKFFLRRMLHETEILIAIKIWSSSTLNPTVSPMFSPLSVAILSATALGTWRIRLPQILGSINNMYIETNTLYNLKWQKFSLAEYKRFYMSLLYSIHGPGETEGPIQFNRQRFSSIIILHHTPNQYIKRYARCKFDDSLTIKVQKAEEIFMFLKILYYAFSPKNARYNKHYIKKEYKHHMSKKQYLCSFPTSSFTTYEHNLYEKQNKQHSVREGEETSNHKVRMPIQQKE